MDRDHCEIEIEAMAPDVFRVRVREGGSHTTHRVTLGRADRQRFADLPSDRVVEESFRFLLEREPKESILQAFELSTIERYFPEFPAEIERRLGGAD